MKYGWSERTLPETGEITMSGKVEWFTSAGGDWAMGSDESRNLLQMAILPQRVPFVQQVLQEYLMPEYLWWGVRIINISFAPMQDHWSRLWEYPWIMKNGNFLPHHKVLDAGGGPSMIPYRVAELCKEVVSCDIEEEPCNKFKMTPTHEYMKTKHDLRGNKLIFLKGDINCLPYPDGYFDRVTCVSVLEHTSTPLKIVQELVRVTAPGGRLLVTMDIADSSHKWNFTVDFAQAKSILDLLGLELTPRPPGTVTRTFSENPPVDIEDPYQTELSVVGFYYNKPNY